MNMYISLTNLTITKKKKRRLTQHLHPALVPRSKVASPQRRLWVTAHQSMLHRSYREQRNSDIREQDMHVLTCLDQPLARDKR